MSGHRPARTWLIAASMLGILAALAVLVVIITVRYRDGLEQRLRTDLKSGASALSVADGAATFKSVMGSLAAEGISVDLTGVTAPGGTLQTTPGEALLTVHELIPFDGREVPATLTGSLAGIDRQVRSLEVTEAIGGVIVLVLLAALARVLVLLDRAVADARASEGAMRTFLADASHELRTPVAALQATAERLLRDQPPRPARDAIEAQLARDSRRLGQLVDDLLNLARLDAREQPQWEPLDLVDLASTALAATRTNGSGAHVELVTDGPVRATGDRDALLRAVRNLLDNASAVADTVVVEVAQTSNGPTMSVTDNGPGVPADQRERIFKPFVRLPRSPRGGTGLGLAIVRRTVRITRRHDHVRDGPDRRRTLHATAPSRLLTLYGSASLVAMPHRQNRTATIAERGELIIEVDRRRPSGRLLRQAGMDASYVDLADATHLEFDYMRWLRTVLRTVGARRVLHIGGGACALARALAADGAGEQHEVCEIDADVLALAREHLGLRRAHGLRVRHTEGRAHIAAQPDRSWDAIVIDAFLGARVPTRLITVEALTDAARVAPLTLINVVDNRAARDVNATASAMANAYASVWTLGNQVGNTIVAGCTDVDERDRLRIAALAAADPSPARLTSPGRVAQVIATTVPLRDATELAGRHP